MGQDHKITKNIRNIYMYIDDLVQNCSNSGALTMGLVQSCTKPSTWSLAISTL